VVKEFRRRYDAIGGSPLIPITEAQAAALEEELRRQGIDAHVAAAMRFSEPAIAGRLRELVDAGVERVVGVVMSPQYSGLLMSGYERALTEAAGQLDGPAPHIVLAPAWHRNKDFLEAVAERIRESLAGIAHDGVAVLLTAHSLPRRVAEQEPDYLAQLRATAEDVARRAGIPDGGWRFCWQSAGHEPGDWMKPDFSDVVPELAASGFRSVVVAPVQFLADHLEILYDVDIGAREQAERAGLHFTRIASLNTMPRFITALATVVQSAAGSPIRSTVTNPS
jgi:ferrochelatase